MGTYSPAPVVTDAVAKQAMDEIMWRTARAMVAEGAPFKGTLFAGLMIKDGKVRLVRQWVGYRCLSPYSKWFILVFRILIYCSINDNQNNKLVTNHPLHNCVMDDLTQAKLLEHNVRFGDPECQSLMARCESDVTEALLLASTGRLDKVDLKWSKEAAVTVVMAAKGYPGDYKKGTVIRGLGAISSAKVCL